MPAHMRTLCAPRRNVLLGMTSALVSAGLSPELRAGTNWPPSGGHVELTRERVKRQTSIPLYRYRVARTYPHDRMSYTEGLTMVDGSIYEGTGLYGQSKLLQWDLETGRVLNHHDLDPRYFGEGVTVLNGAIHQMTYIENTRYTYDQRTFRRTGEFRYETQGWGLTNDGVHLISSNGSSAIMFRDAQTFDVVRAVYVTDDIGPVGFLNELEYVDGAIYANVWQTDFIAKIDAATGKIISWIDLGGLNPSPSVLIYPFVLNGVTVNTHTGRLIVTGKCWPHLYEIDLIRIR
ncbi:MAG: glutaminyl-peptide cyclotransferase [Methylocystis sp.]|uniref:glutaminyl-peptide cyclotransferase n=1 Tax=Methylocystis sp. TaxID=1911079 RepID=UPI003DA3F80E